MTDTTTPPQSTNRGYTILGFQFSRQQLMRAAKLLAAGGIAFCVAFAAWYIPPRATSRLVRSMGGNVYFQNEQVPNMLVTRFYHQQARMFGLTPTDAEVIQVDLSNSKVTDIWLHHLKVLEELDMLVIHERQLGPGLAELAKLPKLSDFSVMQLSSGDLSHLQQLPNLTTVALIRVTGSDIDLSKLASLPRLEFMEIPNFPLTVRQFQQIAQIKTLNKLNISGVKIDAEQLEGVAHLAKLPKLQTLFINDVTVETSAVLAKIESLTHLIISDASLTDEIVASLAQLRNMKIMQLDRCARSIDIEALRRQLPSCQINYSVRQMPAR